MGAMKRLFEEMVNIEYNKRLKFKYQVKKEMARVIRKSADLKLLRGKELKKTFIEKHPYLYQVFIDAIKNCTFSKVELYISNNPNKYVVIF